jgi:hypothetical protein
MICCPIMDDGRPSKNVGALVLHRPGEAIGAQRLGGVQRPIGIVEQHAAQNHEIGTAVGNDLFGSLRRRDQADRRGCNAGVAPNALGERNLIAGMDRNALARIEPAAAGVDEIDVAGRLQGARERNRILQGPSRPPPNRWLRAAPTKAIRAASSSARR